MSSQTVYHIENYGHEYKYTEFNDVIRHIVDSQYPFDPQDDSDVRIFLTEELNNEHDDLELARYELRERRTDLATDLSEANETSAFPQTIGEWTIWVE